MSEAPVGVFDSGLGGLSVAREIHALLPSERLLYLADSANCPYGGRPLEEIRALSVAAVGELTRRGCKLVVVACNTASGAALEVLRSTFHVPVVGLEPAVKPAIARSQRRTVGVMATEATLRTERFRRLIRVHGRGAVVHPRACPGLVELVEEGETGGEAVLRALRTLLEPLVEAGIDTLVLGCTHYPFLRDAIQEVVGPGVEVLDSGGAVARQVERVLRERAALAPPGHGGLSLLTTGDPEEVSAVAARLWGAPLAAEAVDTGWPSPTGTTR